MFPVQQSQKTTPSSVPFSGTVGHGALREGSFVKDKPPWLRQISISKVRGRGGICGQVKSGRRCPASSPCAFNPPSLEQVPLEESELDDNMLNWLNFRRLNLVPVSGGDAVSQVSG